MKALIDSALAGVATANMLATTAAAETTAASFFEIDKGVPFLVFYGDRARSYTARLLVKVTESATGLKQKPMVNP
jgi:hypothetical protein